MKILIPILEDKGMDSGISLHFGHAPFFAIYDSKDNELKIFKNELDHSNQTKSPVDQLMIHNPDILYVVDIGNRAIELFKQKGISLKTGNYEKIKEVIENIDDLDELTGSCGH